MSDRPSAITHNRPFRCRFRLPRNCKSDGSWDRAVLVVGRGMGGDRAALAQEPAWCPAAHAIGRSRGGWTMKVHALTAGNVSDIKAAPALLQRAGRMCYLLTDKGYDADQLRRSLREAGAVPVIPAAATESALSATTNSPPTSLRRGARNRSRLLAVSECEP